MALVPCHTFITTNAETTRTMVRIGAASDMPNHSTDRNAQHTAGTVSRTMIQLSKNSSTLRFIPISSPSEVPTIITMTKPSKIRSSVRPTIRYDAGSRYNLDDALNEHQRPRQHCRQRHNEMPSQASRHTARVINPGDPQLWSASRLPFRSVFEAYGVLFLRRYLVQNAVALGQFQELPLRIDHLLVPFRQEYLLVAQPLLYTVMASGDVTPASCRTSERRCRSLPASRATGRTPPPRR